MPAKFDRWRPTQEEIIRVMITDQKRVSAICGATGSGKTAAYVAGAILSGKPTCIVTDNRGLQDQVLEDFSSCGLVDIRGRSNYDCGLRPDYTCEDGYAARCPYRGTVMCPASQAEMRAAISPLVSTNYAKWTSARKFGTGMTHFQQVIFDEGHQAPGALESAMQVLISHREIEDNLGLDLLSDEASMVDWKIWAVTARKLAEEEMIEAAKKLKGDVKPSWVRHYLHMKNLSRRLSVLSTSSPKDWIVDTHDKGFQFDPIRAGRYGEAALLLRIPRIIIISATLRPKTMFMLGLGQQDFSFTEFDSEFDPKRCPTYWIPTLQINHRVKDLTPLWNRLDQIMSRRRDRKGIIHTVSYARRDELMGRSRFSDSMIVNPQGEPSTETVAAFKRSPPGTTLVSPSVGMGYDFPGLECEWQFICKVPFPDGRSKIQEARRAEDKEYGAYYAMQKLVQALGRGMRSAGDRCENFIVDDNISWFRRNYGHLAPKSFHMFFQISDVVPPPPEKLK
ncbi:MAG: helicase C-terminal domain-containing protein [Nitrospiraceae bacterium]